MILIGTFVVGILVGCFIERRRLSSCYSGNATCGCCGTYPCCRQPCATPAPSVLSRYQPKRRRRRLPPRRRHSRVRTPLRSRVHFSDTQSDIGRRRYRPSYDSVRYIEPAWEEEYLIEPEPPRSNPTIHQTTAVPSAITTVYAGSQAPESPRVMRNPPPPLPPRKRWTEGMLYRTPTRGRPHRSSLRRRRRPGLW